MTPERLEELIRNSRVWYQTWYPRTDGYSTYQGENHGLPYVSDWQEVWYMIGTN